MHWKNNLYFGDNLRTLRDYVPTDSVDLIYLHPACAGRLPFNSSSTYNVLSKKDVAQGPLSGPAAFQVFRAAQIITFQYTPRSTVRLGALRPKYRDELLPLEVCL